MIPSSDDLESKANDERQSLQRSLHELRDTLQNKFDVKRNARENLGVACAVAATVGLITGYAVTNLFVRG